MKAYVILAHKNAAQLCRLVKTLNDGQSVFFIHIDERARIDQFKSVFQSAAEIKLIPRVRTGWAEFGLVEAVLNGLSAVRDHGKKIEHIILLSGQDYPIKSNDYINEFLAGNKDKIFMEHFRLPNFEKWKPNGGMYRVNKYFMGFRTHQRLLAKAANAAAGIMPFLQRKLYNRMAPYAGSMWWSINRSAMHYILDFVNEHPRYTAFHKYTFAADEVFFQTILLNAADEKLASAIVNDDKRFIIWKDKSSAHPEILTGSNVEEMIKSDAIFARKFDISQDAQVFDMIDRQCLSGVTTLS